MCRIVITDHGSFVLLNVYVPNAGKKENEVISERADLKIRFLHALKEKCDSLREEGRKVRNRSIGGFCGNLEERRCRQAFQNDCNDTKTHAVCLGALHLRCIAFNAGYCCLIM